MTGFPILDYELVTRSRNRRTYLGRVALTATGALALLGMMQVGQIGGLTPVELGENLFNVLAFLGLAFCLLAGPVLTADIFSGEKRAGTLPLLFLTSLPASNIVIGRLVSASLAGLYSLLAFLPLPAFGFFLGGVVAGELWRLALLLFSILTLSLTLSGFVSAISWSGRKSLALASLLIAIWTVLPWVWEMKGVIMPLASWFPDPLHWYHSALDAPWNVSSAGFVRRLFVSWLAIAGLLTATILVLPRSLKEPVVGARQSTGRWQFGSRRINTRERLRWYEINPVAWVARQRTPRRGPTLVFLTLFGTTGALAYFRGDQLMRMPDVFLVFVFCLHGLFKLWLAWETSRCLSRDQSEGLLEPLLAAPLSEHQIVHGWIVGLQSVFRWPLMFLLVMDLSIWFGCELGNDSLWLVAWMGVLVFDAFTLLWAGVLLGLLSPSATKGLIRTIVVALVLPWVVGLIFFAAVAVLELDWLIPRHPFTPSVAWIVFSLLIDAILCLYCSHKLGSNFRHLVAEKTRS